MALCPEACDTDSSRLINGLYQEGDCQRSYVIGQGDTLLAAATKSQDDSVAYDAKA